MSTQAKGNARVDAVAASLAGFSFRIVCIKASGRRGDRRRLYHCAGDLLAVHPTGLELQIEVGGEKPITASLQELIDYPWPDAIPVLVRFIDRRRFYHAVIPIDGTNDCERVESDNLRTFLIALFVKQDKRLST